MGFLKRFLAGLAALALLVFLVFGTVNPFGWFWGTHFLTTTPVTRARKRDLLEAWNRKAPVLGLVLGSSQSMKLDPELLARRSGLRYFNFAVSSGTFVDAYTILDYVAERKVPIRQVILGVDPWMFGPEKIAPELLDDWVLSPRIDDHRPTTLWKIGHVARLFGETFTLSSIREVPASIRATRLGLEPLHSFLDNGYLEYRERDRRKAAGTYPLGSMIKDCLGYVTQGTVTAQANPTARLAFFDRTLDRARSMGIDVTVWVPPRHPRLYALLDSVPQYRDWRARMMDLIRKESLAHGARFVDLSTIDKIGGDTLDWYDCVHYGAGNATRATERLLEGRDAGGSAPR